MRANPFSAARAFASFSARVFLNISNGHHKLNPKPFKVRATVVGNIILPVVASPVTRLRQSELQRVLVASGSMVRLLFVDKKKRERERERAREVSHPCPIKPFATRAHNMAPEQPVTVHADRVCRRTGTDQQVLTGKDPW